MSLRHCFQYCMSAYFSFLYVVYVSGQFACLKVSFFLERQYGYYIVQNYIPSMLIVVLSWVAFWINIDAVPARISVGVLTVLTMTTQSVGVWMSLPRVSYVKAIDVWMSVNVMFVFLAMLEFAVVNTLARKEIRRLSLRMKSNKSEAEIPSDMVGDISVLFIIALKLIGCVYVPSTASAFRDGTPFTVPCE